MANTINFDGTAIDISTIDSDWNWYDTLTAFATSKPGISVESIDFKAGATDDECIIRNGSATGPVIFHKQAANKYQEGKHDFNGKSIKPVLVVSEGVYSADSRIIIILG